MTAELIRASVALHPDCGLNLQSGTDAVDTTPPKLAA